MMGIRRGTDVLKAPGAWGLQYAEKIKAARSGMARAAAATGGDEVVSEPM
jgi:hypothetical protein